MDKVIPSAAEVRGMLAPMSYAALTALAKLSGVPFHTLRKVRDGETENPGLETVRKFLPHVGQAIEQSHGGGGNRASA